MVNKINLSCVEIMNWKIEKKNEKEKATTTTTSLHSSPVLIK